MERIKWYFKQLLPLKYVSQYKEGMVKRTCHWRMWFGRSFNVKYFDGWV